MTTARLLLAVAVVLCSGIAAAAGDTVTDSCAAIRDFVDVTFCESKLRSVPDAATADRHGHLLMAADLAASSGGTAGDAAAAAARAGEGVDPAAQDALRACGFLYGSASVPALRLMRGYAAARNWAAARGLLMLTSYAGIGCDAAIGGGEVGKKTMGGADREFHQLASMATALLNDVANGGR